MNRQVSGLCLLVSTCDRNRYLAEHLEELVDRYWHTHPRLYFCGVSGDISDRWLKSSRDQSDWVGILADATGQLLSKGYEKCYLVLDDQPPLYRCTATHLNHTLPDFMDRFSADYIGLHGWGQKSKSPAGSVLGKELLEMEEVPSDYPWRYQLHPALWRLETLHGIADRMVSGVPINDRTPWQFERRAVEICKNSPGICTGRNYRINGLILSSALFRKCFLALVRLLYKVSRRVAFLIGGDTAYDRVCRRFGFLEKYYEGPYPMIWSGLMTKGAINPDLVSYLRFTLRFGFLRRVRSMAAGRVTLTETGS